MDKPEKALKDFKAGLNCSQALLGAFADELGMDRGLALKVASAFGGGMGGTAETCGAVTGACMVLGLRHGREKGRQDDSYDRARQFIERFRSIHGSTVCRELLKCDIATEKGLKQARREGLFATICPRLVEDAARLLEEME